MFFTPGKLNGGVDKSKMDTGREVIMTCCSADETVLIRIEFFKILFQILSPIRLLQNTEQNSLCYTVGPCWLSILNIAVCTCQSQTP